MYVIFTVPFIALIIEKIINVSSRFAKVLLVVCISFAYFLSLYNNLSNNTNQFLSPQMGISYKEIIPKIEHAIPKNSLVIVSPSYNKPIVQLYSRQLANSNIFYFNPFISPESQIQKLEKYQNKYWILINEHLTDTLSISEYLRKKFHHKEILYSKTHKSFMKKTTYDYIEVIKYY
jgi:hypothetical protein